MSDDISDLASVVERRLHGERDIWRKGFDAIVVDLKSKFANGGGASASSAYQKELHRLCAGELHRRSILTVDALLSEHKNLSESPRDTVTATCKDWLSLRIAEEAAELEVHLRSSGPALSGPGAGDSLDDSRRTETDRVSTHVDSYMGQLRRERTERGIRRATRVLAWLRKVLRLS